MFSIRLRAAALLFAIASLAGCSDDITDAASHPWKGDCALTGSLTNATTLVVTGTCQLNELGTATYASTQTLNNTASTFVSTTKFTFANGDELRSTNTGATTSTATGLNITGTETAVGGTGRFSSATGTSAFTGAVSFTGATTTAGTISYNGTVKY